MLSTKFVKKKTGWRIWETDFGVKESNAIIRDLVSIIGQYSTSQDLGLKIRLGEESPLDGRIHDATVDGIIVGSIRYLRPGMNNSRRAEIDVDLVPDNTIEQIPYMDMDSKLRYRCY